MRRNSLGYLQNILEIDIYEKASNVKFLSSYK
jgi:hypothetical protein